MGRTVAIVNQKGGVGKTTTAVNLAASIAVAEHRTLLVDLDPQANATSGLGISPNLARHVYHALLDLTPLADVVHHTEVPFLDMVPSGRDLAGAEIELVTALARENRLRQALAPLVDDYDLILVDCPPSVGLLTLNALVASQGVLIPVQSEYYALEGLGNLLSTVDAVQRQLSPDLSIDGFVLTMTDNRTNLSRAVAEDLRTHFPARTFQTEIPRNVRLSEAPSHGKPILLYDIASKGAAAYLALAAEYLQRLNLQTGPQSNDQK